MSQIVTRWVAVAAAQNAMHHPSDAQGGWRAQVDLFVTADQIVVDILDDGPGIPEAEREKVFQSFYRIEHSRSRESGEFGLGMTVACATIRAQGGGIVLVDRPEGGGRVAVSLPPSP
ncbi:ATP-binding protein [Azospirillum brasilense]|uniref:ATP-binding protein n=1 Tax=Azospirillum brasilense TaxID=192 RepID=UPI0013B37860|nr:ATP-binding protein [Azospirillum brasilense]